MVLVTSTQTVIGWAIPSAATMGYGIIPFLLPIIFAGLLALTARRAGLEGETSSFVIKLGLLIGCLLGMLSVTAVAPSVIPFAFPVIAAVYLVTYIWKKV